ncbi:MAG: NapC/NirT family cytochrome c [Ignavibacteriae bacterium]|nr:NapC/NirT family cytochrome c [Ignavibacteriota bacterium]
MTRRRLPDIFYNPISIGGAAIASVTLLTIVFLTAVELLQPNAPAYIGIISYIVLPLPLILGLLLIPLGAWRERRRLRRGQPASRLSFTVDLAVPRQRAALTLFSGVTFIVLLFTAYGSYRVFEWTESVPFCGETCHSVMEPEFTAYQNSPHARVKCVECHVGSGAGWYMRSKLSGAYQVYAVIANVYPTPIPTPIANLRPARETCEQCHWPSHFSAEKKYVNTYFKSDSANTRWTIGLLMKIGGGSDEHGPAGGIHWHISPTNEIQFATSDSQRQVIPYVRVKDLKTGSVTEYVVPEEASRMAEFREKLAAPMSCIDCHNRPSHIYRPPARIVDQSLARGRISLALPHIREKAIEALKQEYTSTEVAMDSIALQLKEFYATEYPSLGADQRASIDAAVQETQRQYKMNFFPKMRVRWSAYPNNIGHMTDLGCFRCHDGNHASADGRVISKDCNTCHTILYQGTDIVPQTLAVGGLPFQHPEDIGDGWNEMNCVECHSGR